MAFVSNVINVLLIVLGFGVLIFVHELGHFIAAKWAGIRTEAFAIGMGPVVCSWRKGIGFRLGSTWKDYQARVRQFLSTDGAHQLKSRNDADGEKEPSQEETYRIGDKLGLGETEYSLRWLPIGGFVKMLGQEDANPNYVSDDPRSYNRCPIGKRMIVVSAGVLMNLLLAIIVFIVAFMVGVRQEAPVIGDVTNPDLAASTTMADNAAALGITEPGLRPGDVVLSIDGEPAETFADLQIASAMSRPGVPVNLTVRRAGVSEPLQFSMLAKKDPGTGLLSFGIAPGASTTLTRDTDGFVELVLAESGLASRGVMPGMSLRQISGQDVTTFEQVQVIVEESGGKPATTTWAEPDERTADSGTLTTAPLNIEPAFQVMRMPDAAADAVMNFDVGLFGLAPLVRIRSVIEGSANEGILKAGDVVLKLGSIEAPRQSQFFDYIHKHEPGELPMTVLRDGQIVEVRAIVQRRGLLSSTGALNVRPALAWDVPLIATPMDRVGALEPLESGAPKLTTVPSAAAALNVMGRSRIDAVGDEPVGNWADIRKLLRLRTESAFKAHEGATVPVRFTLPTPGAPQETGQLALSSADVQQLHELGWQTDLVAGMFEPLYTIRTADGNPLKAVRMGFDETYKMVIMTYLTIDRLVRGSVGVEQLRGPVGIVHLGTKVLQKGWMYSLMFLAIISVNLAVINFLPLPIVDGGLFLFLIYEKLKGRPPSIAFQNVATIVGLCIIGALFLVTFYNDVLRLFS